jgi:hypothetical protein
VLINGENNLTAVADGSYTFENITEDQTVHVTFAINSYTITASAGENGSISPNGIVTVNYGANSEEYIFTPVTGYHIETVLINGENNLTTVADGSYTFENVTEDQTIHVTFTLITNIANITANTKINVYPNPTNGQLRIENYESSMGGIGAYDMTGRVVFTLRTVETRHATSLQSDATTLDISHLPAGVYFLRVGNETVKVVKQ